VAIASRDGAGAPDRRYRSTRAAALHDERASPLECPRRPLGTDELRASASTRSAPASLLPLRKSGSAAFAIDFHATGHADGTRAEPTAEVKRRTNVIGRFPGETSCLTLVWAVLDLYISHATNGIKFTQLERQRLKNIRYRAADQATPEEVTAA
jgi:hypothetical protein